MIVILTTGGWYPLGLIVHQQRYPPSDSNTDYWVDGILLGLIVHQQRYPPSDSNTDYWWMVSSGTNSPPAEVST